MKVRSGVAALAALLTLSPLAALSADVKAGPADGVYRFTMTKSGSTIGSSTITVKHSADKVKVNEDIKVATISAQVQASYDLGTLAESGYVAELTAKGQTQHLTATPVNGGINLQAGSQNIDVMSIKSAPTVFVGDNFVGSLFMLPSVIHASGATSLTEALIFGGKGILISTLPSSTPGILNLNMAGVDVIITYDPQNFVVSRISIPSQDTVIAAAS